VVYMVGLMRMSICPTAASESPAPQQHLPLRRASSDSLGLDRLCAWSVGYGVAPLRLGYRARRPDLDTTHPPSVPALLPARSLSLSLALA
jgi:hypothetical protein